jgi:pantoate kinase
LALRATAFAPAHITGFFEICDTSENVLRKGSRGAGLCLDLGVTTKVSISKGKKKEIFLNKKRSRADVTRTVAHVLAPDFRVQVKSTLDLPIGQGLGMSGAGALSTAIAIADALELPRKEAVYVAHEAEIISRTGLGDVGPQSLGGMTIRLKPGPPPRYGKIRSIPVDDEVEIVVGIVGRPIKTKKVITDSRYRKRINRAGKDCVAKLSKRPTLERLFTLSRKFAEGTGLVTRKMARALKAVDRFGMGSMSMIGNSIFAYHEDGDTAKIVRVLKRHVRKVFICHIDNQGARIV